jgi:V8-like Glu-specific endopeptidase
MGASRVSGVIVVCLITVMSIAYTRASWAQFKLPPSAGAPLGKSSLRYAQTLESLPSTGTRYQTLRPAWIHEKPDEASRIVYDVDRLRIVYAEPTSDPQWLQAKAIGDERMPSYYQLGRPSSSTDRQTIVNSKDGRLQLIAPNHFDDVVPTFGFVRAKDLVNAENRAAARDSMKNIQNLQPFPPLWSKIGATDNRSFLLNLDMSPGNAIALIKIRGNLCSGAFVRRHDIVLTAAHCLVHRDWQTSDAMVKVWRGPGRIENIKATLLAKGDFDPFAEHDDGEDWALLQLERAPSLKVEPLEFFVDGDSFRAAQLQLLMVGYPADSIVPAVHQYQFLPATVSPCEVFASSFRIRQKNNSTATMATLDARCIGNHGNSGGPILLWNEKRKRFEIIAIDNRGLATNFVGGNVYRYSLSSELATLVDRNKKEIVDRYKSVYGIDERISETVTNALSELGVVEVSADLGEGLDLPGRRNYQSKETDIFTKGAAVPGIASLRSAIVTSYGYTREYADISLNHKILETLQRMTGTLMDVPIGLGSDLIEDDRRQPRWFAFDDPLQRHVTEPMYISSILDRSVREWCANQCEAEWLSPHKQLRVRLGDSIDLNQLADTRIASITGIKTKENWVKIPIVGDRNSDVKLLTGC